jgi:hypothetical protein
MLSKRQLLGGLLLVLGGSTVQAAEPLLGQLQLAIQGCGSLNSREACQQVRTITAKIQQQPGYRNASHLCKEEVSELQNLLTLFKEQDAVPNELMSSGWDVQQACSPFQL